MPKNVVLIPWIEREEYDGSEWWEKPTAPEIPSNLIK